MTYKSSSVFGFISKNRWQSFCHVQKMLDFAYKNALQLNFISEFKLLGLKWTLDVLNITV